MNQRQQRADQHHTQRRSQQQDHVLPLSPRPSWRGFAFVGFFWRFFFGWKRPFLPMQANR